MITQKLHRNFNQRLMEKLASLSKKNFRFLTDQR